MYQTLTFYHSLTRWLVLGMVLWAIGRAGSGFFRKQPFTPTDDAIRHWTATIAHIQLLLGVVLYFRSPITQYFRVHFKEAVQEPAVVFFGWLHPLLMLTAITVLTLGSALAKRRDTDTVRFKTQLIWFSAALGLMLLAIPWPFSPLASRPYFR